MSPADLSSSLSGALASEGELVEGSALELFEGLGWEVQNLFKEVLGPTSPTGRLSPRTVYLPARLRAALQRLNPALPPKALAQAEDELTADRSAMSAVAANREVYRLLRDGVAVQVAQEDGSLKPERVQLIDWVNVDANDFCLASQIWIASESYTRRPDAVGYVNGIPVLLCEWKAPTAPVQEAYDANLRDYRDTIPRLFDANGFTLLSNGIETLMGPSHAAFEGFAPWKKLEEDGPDRPDLETMLRATCAPGRFLDLLENFVLFEEGREGLRKLTAKYHQVLGVNRAIEAVKKIADNQGRLGVFWHTQGSGKSFSMVMFAEKVLRRLGGNWTFVVVTDRQELDDQIAQTFAATGALTKQIRDAQAQSRVHLRELLAGQERYVFTLIHKFSTESFEQMPVLSERKDIIVITDEAHRSQYDQLATNMRRALPNAAFIGFTGTPLIAGEEERTRDVFGEYVSVYNFAQSAADGATVPLYYENRKPELQIASDALRDDLTALLDEVSLNEEQEKKLHREFGRQYHLITRDDRLDEIAADLVRHLSARGYLGKAMFVAIDKATAVRMYDKVRVQWAALIAEKEQRLAATPDEAKAALAARLDWMKSLDMAVVVSQGQNEIADLKAKGLDIVPHRKRMQEEDLETRFKNPDDPLRLVFVCAMWITGFDVPTCSTIYLDKPMKNHTLMQTIARANRRAPGKAAGVVVDYVGVFQNLKKALAIYAASQGGDSPIKNKDGLVEELVAALASARCFCDEIGVDLDAIPAANKLSRLKLIGDAVETLIAPDERRREFMRRAGGAVRSYKALLPDDKASAYFKQVATLHVLAEALRAKLGPVDLSAVAARIEALLDERIEGIAISAPIIEGDECGGRIDLSDIDFNKLGWLFNQKPKTTAEKLRSSVEKKAAEMAAQNPSRVHFVEKLEKLVDAYNLGTLDVEAFFDALKKLIARMEEEERRAVAEGLTEDELAIFDLLTRPEPKLTKAQEDEVKKVARELFAKLKGLRVEFWRQNQQTRAAVHSEIRFTLDDLPQEPYPETLWEEKVEAVWQYVYHRNGNQSGDVRL
ncbi:type I site-specific deoxyribonuclease, HsdR family [Rhodomicrobium vannielii ATCC 17100]|uniref:Type I restriction enzyme endonuclease subunit n=1 Tax=Rhodomicrobium vannielii (strain ATCC 17100 / DSM 162 / LMG 4299 / NCIMB 10020 / ATH 3.1.1) TaxID=648757 RepID=E3I0Q1_RHOVT|nr:type I restriction endonuclease subunit R [Rhodomicrobium vannielii]ADP71141.1 type I site-specific deoxyribonuclease, HsdR family [Rhodomicrobium vannielii ATCC 17100]